MSCRLPLATKSCRLHMALSPNPPLLLSSSSSSSTRHTDTHAHVHVCMCVCVASPFTCTPGSATMCSCLCSDNSGSTLIRARQVALQLIPAAGEHLDVSCAHHLLILGSSSLCILWGSKLHECHTSRPSVVGDDVHAVCHGGIQGRQYGLRYILQSTSCVLCTCQQRA